MKKLIAVLIALAMVLSMSVMAFAEFAGVKSPVEAAGSQEDYEKALGLESWQLEDYANWWNLIDTRDKIEAQGIYKKDDGNLMTWAEAWQAYYAYVLQNATSDPQTAITEIMAMVSDGYISAGDAITIAGETAMGGIGGDGESGDLSGIVDQIIGGITGGDKEPEVSSEEYAEELKALINEGAEFDAIASKIGEDIASGKIVVSQLPEIAQIISDGVDTGAIEDNETVQKVLEFINGIGGDEGGINFPDFGDIELPWDSGNSESGSFLDTILGIIGSIGDIFNPSEPDDPADDPSNPGTSDPIPDTGDVSFVAVAAVVAVAGAALVLTRKKSDAE